MNSKYVQSKFDYIDLLFHYFDSASADEYMKSHISKYLTVLISGIYEDIVKTTIDEYLSNSKSSEEVKKYINESVNKSFRNPDTGNLKSLLRKFSKDWSDSIDSLESSCTASLDSIVNNKNLIAHGANCPISYESIKEYYTHSKNVIIELDKLLYQGTKS